MVFRSVISGTRVAILTILFSASAHAAHKYHPSFHARHGGIEGKMQYCTYCHGLAAQGYRGYYPIPRLAGQTSTYIENQLQAFSARKRERNNRLPMWRVHGLSPEMRTTLATHFAESKASPIGGAPARLAEAGKKIYDEGIPDANVPACSACHGPQAMGDGPVPRLAGQLYPYTVKELGNWSKERGQEAAAGQDTGQDTSAVMAPIAQSMTKAQMQAVAAYVARLR